MIRRRTQIGNGLKFDNTTSTASMYGTSSATPASFTFDPAVEETIDVIFSYEPPVDGVVGLVYNGGGNLSAGSNSYFFSLVVNPTGAGFYLNHSTTGGGAIIFQSFGIVPFTSGQTVRLTLVKVGTGATSDYLIYVNGVLHATYSGITNPPASPTSGVATIGRLWGGNPNIPFSGAVYSIKHYKSYAASATQVLNQDYPSATSSQLYVDFNHTRSTTIRDYSPNSLNFNITAPAGVLGYGQGGWVDEKGETAK